MYRRTGCRVSEINVSRLVMKRSLLSVTVFVLNIFVAIIMSDQRTAGQDSTNSTKKATDFRVVGYLPDYRIDQIDVSAGKYLTDLVFFSVAPEPSGKFISKVLDSPKTVALLKRFRDRHRVHVMLCVGGWERSNGFAEIASTDESRRMFAKGLTAYCQGHGFSGADIDWEHPKDALEAENYGRLMSGIALAFKPHGLKLSAAIAAWQTLTPEWIQAVDAVHLMSYDAPGKHSTLETAKADVRKLVEQGVPASKIRLGLPFYGRGITQPEVTRTYAQLVAGNPKSTDQDEIDGVYFNGPSTIRSKVQFAKEQKLGGIMIWEIGQDAPGNASLLKVIQETVK